MSAPRYRLITGDFYILYPDLPRNGPEPDGDTISFLPDDDDLVQALPWFNDVPPGRKHLGTYSVRFEGIDALETHFNGEHQNLAFAISARDLMLGQVGFEQVEFFPDRPNKVSAAAPHPLPGYLLATGVEANGRVLAQVYAGQPDPGRQDGDRVFVEEPLLDRGVNAALVRAGLAYAELYTTMPFSLITHMRQLVTQARADQVGFWPHEDLTLARAVQPTSIADLSNLVMFPKLYRRLVSYFSDGHSDLTAFDTWVRASPDRDDLTQLPTGERGHLHDLYQVDASGLRLRLRLQPEQVTFLE
jgi:endonuclease YncB( thermonuclease family)